MPAQHRRQPPPDRVRLLLPREFASWTLLALALGAVEGGLLGMIVKTFYQQAASDLVVNLAVALVSGAPAFANIVSLAVTARAQGRDKVGLIAGAMAALGLALLVLAWRQPAGWGLLLFCVAAVAARMAWSVILTLRSVIWRANFPREMRARLTAGLTRISALTIAASSALVGWAAGRFPEHFQWLFALAGVAALAGAWVYRHTRTRLRWRLLRDEQAAAGRRRGIRLVQCVQVLRENTAFRDYMSVMFVFGSANLMLIGMLVVYLNEQFGLPRLSQVLLTASIPLLMIVLTIQRWARLLDGNHIIHYRARHSWSFVAAFVLFSAAVVTDQPLLLWPGAMVLGVAYAGGELGWNLGHNDFARDGDAALYMATHVTLTGIRGLLMPMLGILFYQWLDGFGRGHLAILLPMMLSVVGASGFVYLAWRGGRVGLDGERPGGG